MSVLRATITGMYPDHVRREALALLASGASLSHVSRQLNVSRATLREALGRMLADRELRRRFGEAGRERIREHFSWPAVTDATIAAYEAVLA